MLEVNFIKEYFAGDWVWGKEGDTDIDDSKGEVYDVDDSEAIGDAKMDFTVPDEMTNCWHQDGYFE